ncbi:hypothetical protein CYCME_0509 [Cycloclasticus zancles 78-ME]|uniref:Uncharacterized protein n=1 Tax=Cycloclasticus zancles 78-ME TaxID=1198232 RepID=S5TUW6_9GAMM|nr:hypothetical protein CYCME_0509 [Cycloclasticus zancles 78-ME]
MASKSIFLLKGVSVMMLELIASCLSIRRQRRLLKLNISIL